MINKFSVHILDRNGADDGIDIITDKTQVTIIRVTYTVFIGGGAALLKKLIEKSDRLGKYMFIEDICANAKGYDKLYQMMTAEE